MTETDDNEDIPEGAISHEEAVEMFFPPEMRVMRDIYLEGLGTPRQKETTTEYVEMLEAMTISLADENEGLSTDLHEAVAVAFNRGARLWTRDNHPSIYEKLTKLEPALSAEDYTELGLDDPADENKED